ncbi:fibronectin type III domain-containing protein [Tenacibaculum sp. M341]|uniref:fibronectin type III domain-containing protein n=1 Tax=Tenacibaculum sp. M341 TaxID=2530339 RepID=UPI00104D321F|nr:fibronectin type III domain-containing protein [Tenacibaculum sp. M341]TCI84411.1 T9SS type A sorting domain-containing protein [Tenacibaculum sp. M341]
MKSNFKQKIIVTCALLFLGLTTNAQRPFFNKNKDLLIAQFDSKPDPDDIHAQAALGSMLLHNDLKGVNYYAVAGAYGRQNGRFIDSDELFDLAFGKNNWTDADENWTASVNRIKNKVIPILNNGGKVWVQEAGQSDITADWVAEAIKAVGGTTVKNNVIVVQHSKWNQDQTTPSDLNYVRSKTNYFYVDDGNADFTENWGDHGPYDTPRYRSRDSKWIAQAKSSPNKKAREIWIEADRVVRRRYPQGVPYDWSWMKNNGLDYSDCVENWWILNIGDKADNVTKFWNRYVVNTTGSNPDSGSGSDTGSCMGKVFEEKNGIVAVEAEDYVKQSETNDREWFVIGNSSNTPKPDPDGSHASTASRGKYVELLPDTRVTHGDPLRVGVNFSDTPGKAVLDYKIKFNSPGKYFVWVRAYSTGSEDNGIHVGIDGTWPSSGRKMQWCTGKNQWTWESKQRTNANHCGEPEKIFINVPSAGVHTVSFSMREDGFEIDKFILSKTYVKPTGNGLNAVAANCDNDNDNGNTNVCNAKVIKGLKTIASTKTSITLEFDEVSGIENYELRAWKKGDFTGSINEPKAVAFEGGNSSPLTISGLTEGTEYTLVLRGICGVGKSTELSQINTTTVADAPKCSINSVITGLKATDNSKNSITVAFDELSGVDFYELRAWKKGDFTGSINEPKAVSFKGGNASPLTITELNPGEEYTLVLRGVCEVGKSTKISQINAVTKDDMLTDGIYYIQNPTGNIRINSPSGSLVSQANTSGNSAKWEITKVNDYYTIRNVRNNEYLEVPFRACETGETSQNPNVNLGTYSEVRGDHQRWKITKVGADYFIQPLHCDKAVDRPVNKPIILLWTLDTSNTNQNWRIIKATASRASRKFQDLNANDATTITNETVNIYPNPVVDENFTILLGEAESSEIVIFDIQGKKVYHHQSTEKSINLKKENIGKSGLYFIKIKQGLSTTIKKIILQ